MLWYILCRFTTRGGSGDHALDSREQRRRRNGLGNKFVGARVEAFVFGNRRRISRQDHDRQSIGAHPAGPEKFYHVRSAHVRHVEIENGEVDLLRDHNIEGRAATLREGDVVSGVLKYLREEQLVAPIVIGEQDFERVDDASSGRRILCRVRQIKAIAQSCESDQQRFGGDSLRQLLPRTQCARAPRVDLLRNHRR